VFDRILRKRFGQLGEPLEGHQRMTVECVAQLVWHFRIVGGEARLALSGEDAHAVGPSGEMRVFGRPRVSAVAMASKARRRRGPPMAILRRPIARRSRQMWSIIGWPEAAQLSHQRTSLSSSSARFSRWSRTPGEKRA